MQLLVDDRQAAQSLVRFLRRLEYLAVHEPAGIVEVEPIRTEGALADRRRIQRDIAEWCAGYPGVDVTPVAEG